MGAGRSKNTNFLSNDSSKNPVLAYKEIPKEVSSIGDRLSKEEEEYISKLSGKEVSENDILQILSDNGITFSKKAVSASIRGKVVKYDPLPLSSLPSLSRAYLKMSLETLVKLQEEFIKIKGEKLIKSFSFNKGGKTLDTQVSGSFAESVSLLSLYRPAVYSTPVAYFTPSNHSISGNFRQAPAKVTVMHEFGHAIYSYLGRSYKEKLSSFLSTTSKMPAITGYGNSSPKEAFAEAFAAYRLGVKVSSVSPSYYHNFVSLMESTGLGSLSK